MEGHPFGTRCPACMGETRVILHRDLIDEPNPAHVTEANRKLRQMPHYPEDSATLAVLLDNIRSAWNVGSILRSADGFGFTHAYLCGITPTGDNETVMKTSLGAEEAVPWSYHKDGVKLVKGLKKEGWKIFALENDDRAMSLESGSLMLKVQEHALASLQAPLLQILIVGNEVTGVDPELLDLCDKIYYIPMRGEKKSFNVAIAFSVAAYTLSTQRSQH
jgi:tRNA G18 (ribose-2'-O)-methylase SpoU